MSDASLLKELLEAGVHYGHQTRRWNPKMAPYIFGERNGIHIIDLRRTLQEIERACDFVRKLSADGGVVLFVGTKRQVQSAIEEAAGVAGMPYVNFRWLGGMLTNFKTINRRIFYMKELTEMESSGVMDQLPKKERLRLRRELVQLERALGGVSEMEALPSAMFVVDVNSEQIAVKEAVRLKIPVIALTDTNCDPDDIEYVIPGNDDAIRSASLVANTLAAACAEGRRLAEEEVAAEEAAAAAERSAEEPKPPRQAVAPPPPAPEAPSPPVAEEPEAAPAAEEPPADDQDGPEAPAEVAAEAEDSLPVADSPVETPAGEEEPLAEAGEPAADDSAVETSPEDQPEIRESQ